MVEDLRKIIERVIEKLIVKRDLRQGEIMPSEYGAYEELEKLELVHIDRGLTGNKYIRISRTKLFDMKLKVIE